MNVKKIFICILFVIVILCIGFFSGRVSAGRGTEELEKRAIDLENQLEKQAERNKELTGGLREANRENGELTAQIGELTEENRILTEKIGNIGAGLSEDIKGVQSVIEGLEVYIKKAQVPENNNNS